MVAGSESGNMNYTKAEGNPNLVDKTQAKLLFEIERNLKF